MTEKINQKESIIIYTDGGCRGNPGLGAWGAVLKTSKHRLEIGLSAENTTNNKMELSAALFALKKVKKSSNIELYTDSNYLVLGMTKWVFNWNRNNWIKSDKKPVENKELWQELLSVSKKHVINFHWVRGHDGDIENERADEIVNILMDEHQKTKKIATFHKKY